MQNLGNFLRFLDLVVETPRDQTFAIEIKAKEYPDSNDLRGLKSFSEICPKAKLYCASLAPRPRHVNGISILPWQEIFEILRLN